MLPQILLNNGRYFDFTDMSKNELDVYSAAAAISKQCRFTGQTMWYYSTAMHSVLVSYLVPPEFALEGLCHDLHEAFVGDMSSPLKTLIPQYNAIEAGIEGWMRDELGLPEKMSEEVHIADMQALMIEKRCYMNVDAIYDIPWMADKYDLYPEIDYLSEVLHNKAERLWVDRFLDLTCWENDDTVYPNLPASWQAAVTTSKHFARGKYVQ